jgi:hypothetical protein
MELINFLNSGTLFTPNSFGYITAIDVYEESHLSVAYITQIVSDSGVEDFDFFHARSVIFRKNVTSITFKIEGYNSYTRARWMINRWS